MPGQDEVIVYNHQYDKWQNSSTIQCYIFSAYEKCKSFERNTTAVIAVFTIRMLQCTFSQLRCVQVAHFIDSYVNSVTVGLFLFIQYYLQYIWLFRLNMCLFTFKTDAI